MTGPRPLALVAFASSGIGSELARRFAGGGFGLVIDADRLPVRPAEHVSRAGATVEAVQADLSPPGACRQRAELRDG